jgi:hypothetical protein
VCYLEYTVKVPINSWRTSRSYIGAIELEKLKNSKRQPGLGTPLRDRREPMYVKCSRSGVTLALLRGRPTVITAPYEPSNVLIVQLNVRYPEEGKIAKRFATSLKALKAITSVYKNV